MTSIATALLLLPLWHQVVEPAAHCCCFVAEFEVGSELETRFREEYPGAFKRLLKPLQNVCYEGHRVRDDYEADVTFNVKGEYAQEIMRFDKEKRIKTYPDVRVNTYSRPYEFRLGKTSPNDSFFVEYIKTGKARTEQTDLERRWRIDRFVQAGFRLFQRTVEDVLSDDKFRIVDIRNEEEHGREIIDVSFSLDPWRQYEGARETLNQGNFRVVPTLDWALSRYELKTTIVGENATRRQTYIGEIDCDRWIDGFVGPKRVHLVVVNETSGTASTISDIADFRTAAIGTVDDSQFKLSAFRLPDSLLVPENGTGRRWFQSWLFWSLVSCGVILWVAGIMLRRLKG